MWRVFGYSTNVSTRRLKYLDLDDLRPNLPLLDVQNLHSADPTLTNNVFEQMQIMQGVTRQDELYRTDGENRWHKVSRWSIGNLFSLSAGVWAFRFACFLAEPGSVLRSAGTLQNGSRKNAMIASFALRGCVLR